MESCEVWTSARLEQGSQVEAWAARMRALRRREGQRDVRPHSTKPRGGRDRLALPYRSIPQRYQRRDWRTCEGAYGVGAA